MGGACAVAPVPYTAPVKTKPLDPRRLDVAAFAEAAASLAGEVPLHALARLTEGSVAPGDGAVAPVRWSAEGLWRQPAGRPAEIRLRLRAEAEVWLACQRCLEPLRQPLRVDRVLRFVPGEDEAARLDEEGEEDVLALTRSLDLQELVEDELILELPVVPRHDRCPVELGRPPAGHGAAAADAAPHPFAALAALKAPKSAS